MYIYETPNAAKFHLILFHILKLTRQAIYFTRKTNMKSHEDYEQMKEYMRDIILAVSYAIDIEEGNNV